MTRARTRERRRERQQQQRRQRQIVLVGGLVALAVLAVVVIILVNQPAEAPIPAESRERYAGIPQGKTEEGYPILGDPDAPVELIEYSSFDCPHCRDFHEGVTVTLIDRVRAGEMSFTYVPVFGTGSFANGEGAARAAVCAGEQGAFWPYHDALFTWQGVYGNAAFAQNRLVSGIENLGLNRAEWEQCLRSDLPDRVVLSREEALDEVENFSGTPMVLVNGVVVPNDLQGINSAIDQALAFGSPPSPEATTEPEATAEAEATTGATAEATDAP
jgi:protein-disulfide isomerase